MLKGYYIVIFLLLLLPHKYTQAQTYEIEVQIPIAANKEIQLTYHYLDKIYAHDTILLDSEGNGVFKGDSILTQGLYKILIDKDNHFDFLLGEDQQFKISKFYNKLIEPNTYSEVDYESISKEISKKDNKVTWHFEKDKTIFPPDSTDIKVEGAVETQYFISYLAFLENLKKEGNALNKKYKTADATEKPKIAKQLNNLTNNLHNKWEEIGEKLPNSFLYKFLKANEVPKLDISTLPEEIQQNDSLLLRARFTYQHEHFWDNFDYTDERFLYTPFYKPKLETWFKKVLYPDYDSVKPYVYEFLDKVEHNKRIFQFTTSFFLNSSINSNIMGMDALFIDLAYDYYLNGKAFWANEESLEKIRENVLFIKDNLIGKTAPDLTLEDFDGEFINLHQLESEVTVVLIYEPNCGHCKTFIPEFYKDVFLPNKEKGLEVFAIYSMDNKEEWTDFLTKHNMFQWHNVWDKDHVSRFKILYDARKTPGVYVLDHDKKIIAKKVTVEQLKNIVAEKLD